MTAGLPRGTMTSDGGGADEEVAVGWALSALTAAAVVVGLVVRLTAAAALPGQPDLVSWALGAGWLITSLVGAVIVQRRPRSVVGWLFVVTGPLHAAWDLADLAAELRPTSVTSAALGWVSSWVYVPAFLLPALALLRVPDDALPSPRWRVVWYGGLGALAMGTAAGMLGPVAPSLPAAAAGALVFARMGAELTLPILLVTALAGLVVRFRRADRPGRQQLKWVLLGVLVVVSALALQAVALELGIDQVLLHAVLSAASIGAVPLGAGLAILRYGTFEVDLVLNRTLTYVVVCLVLGTVTVGGTALLGLELGRRSGLGTAILGAAVVALLAHPLRVRAQEAIDRLMFGDRRNPYAVMTRLAEQLAGTGAGEQALSSVAAQVGRSLRLPYVAITLEGSPTPAAEHGRPVDAVERFPLVHAEEPVGVLLAGQRSGREPFSTTERHLLGNLARQLGAAAHAARLRRELQHTNELLVVAREEERRRLRRELHDGLGPTLAGVALSLRAARSAVTADPKRAAALLDRSHEQLAGLVRDVRHIVHELRPPTLDELGLVEAIREQALRLATGEATGLHVDIDATALPVLPAAVELAAYRIATEAVTNVVRHAGATRCLVRLGFDGALVVEVHDDGHGLRDAKRGVGMASMSERARELGGHTAVESRPGEGTLVRSVLPAASP